MARMRLVKNAVNNSVEGFCIVKSAAVRQNVKGTDYLDMVLADADGEIAAKLWDYDPEQHGGYYPESIIKVRGTVTVWKDVEQLKIERIRAALPSDEVDLSALLPCAPFDSQWMYDQLMECVADFRDLELQRLVQYLLRQHKARLLRYPAALKLHHAQRGGLLYHTLSILKLAKSVCENYPALNPDLLYTGVMLHDIAKIYELETGELGLASGYTAEGQLLGHINMGMSMVEQAAMELDIPRETSMLVSHMLLSHHGVPEFGSPRPPMFPEAEVLNALDMLDSRMFEMFSALEGVEVGGFSERIWALDNRQLYKHGK